MKPFLLKHLSGESTGRFPVWMMRQAGRYLPSYREIRSRYSFWEMVTKPEIAEEVSLLPLKVLDVDAIILFSDILTLPYGLGIPIELIEGVGPVVRKPLADQVAFEVFSKYQPETHTAYVGAALEGIRTRMPPDKTLLGFAGAPWTVASYLIEGRPNRQFEEPVRWLNRDPAGLAKALELLAQATTSYLLYQVRCGAQAIQLFDTWAFALPINFFSEFYLPILNTICERLRKERVPVIYFVKQARHLLGPISDLSMDVLGVDSLVPLDQVDTLIKGRFSLQGNLDPTTLLTDPVTIRETTKRLVNNARLLKRPAILNLGHGILRQTPVENAKAFIDEAKSPWT